MKIVSSLLDARPNNTGISTGQHVRDAAATLQLGKGVLDSARAEDIVWALSSDDGVDSLEIVNLTKKLLAAPGITPGASLTLQKLLGEAESAIALFEKQPSKLASWLGRSPTLSPQAQKMMNETGIVRHAVGEVLDYAQAHADPRAAVIAALDTIDPGLAELVKQESKYAVGIGDLGKRYPALATAMETWQQATPAERESAVALMQATLLPQARSLSLRGLADEIAGGRRLDVNTAIDVARAAVIASQPDTRGVAAHAVVKFDADTRALLAGIMKAPQQTELGAAFLRGFTEDGLDVTESRIEQGLQAMRSASSPVAVIENALPAFDKKLAAMGCSSLFSGEIPEIEAAYDALLESPSENPRAVALAAMQQHRASSSI